MVAPKLRFKEFSGDWENKVYKDVINIKYGKDHKHLINGEIPVYGTGGVMRYVDQYLYDGESILIGRKGTIDQPKYVNEKFWTVDTLFYSEIKPIAMGQFLFQHALQVNWLALNEATGVPSLNTTSINNVKINLPCIEEQTKIAKFLTQVDQKIEQLTQKHKLLTQYKKGMMQKLFSQHIRFKADDGSEFGEWKEDTLANFAKINPKSSELPDKFIYIDLESVISGTLVKKKLIDLENAPSRAQRIIQNHDILFQTVRPYQQNNYYFDIAFNKYSYVASSGYAQIRTNQNSKFLYYLIHTKYFLDNVLNQCTGTSFPAVSSSDLANIKISMPSCKEQTKIANFLSSIDQKIDLTHQQLQQAKQWKKGLLQQMFV